MLGRNGVIEPLFIRNSAGPWLGLSVCIDRSTHRSSAQRPIFGTRSLTSSPLLPHLLYGNGTAISPPVLFSVRSSTALGRWPAYLLIAGLGSKRSPWNGPPFMKS